MSKKHKKKQRESDVRFFTSAFGFTDFCLVLTEKDLDDVCAYLEIDKSLFIDLPSSGRVDFLQNDKTGKNVAVMRIQEEERYSLAEHIGLIAHECTHIKQAIMEDINEHKPSHEFEAYQVQELVTNMVDEYFRRSALFGKDKVLTQTNLATGETQTFNRNP